MPKKTKIAVLYSGHQFDYLYGLITSFNELKQYDIQIIDAIREHGEVYPAIGNHIKILKLIDKRLGHRILRRLWNVTFYYIRLFKFILFENIDIYHIEWLNFKSARFEEIIIPIIIKIKGAKIIYKVHDISTDVLLSNGESDFELKIPTTKKYFLNQVSIFIVHNPYTERVLIEHGIANHKIKKIRHGINNSIINTGLTQDQAKVQLGINEKRCLLFFGSIAPYKNIENLIIAIQELNKKTGVKINLIIAGKFRANHEKYEEKVRSLIAINKKYFSCKFQFIDKKNVEMYFKAADAIVLPYKFIFQSGLVFLAMRFNLPVIAKNVGGLAYDIIQNKTGILYENDSDLICSIKSFYSSSYFMNKEEKDSFFLNHKKNYNWKKLSSQLDEIYKNINT